MPPTNCWLQVYNHYSTSVLFHRLLYVWIYFPSYTWFVVIKLRCGCLSAVGQSPAVKEYAEPVEMSETKLPRIVSVTGASTENSWTAMTLTEWKPDSSVDCKRKRARKTRLCVKNEPSPELSHVGKTTHRQYHRPPTPDTSPIRLLPFSPSQVTFHRCFLSGWCCST